MRGSRLVSRLPHRCALSHSRRISNQRSLRQAFVPASSRNQADDAQKVGLFNIPELAAGPEGYTKLADDAIASCEQLIKQAHQFRGRTAVIDVMDNISNTLCKVADMADLVRSVGAAEDAEAAGAACGRISSLVETLNTDPELYALVKEVLQTNQPHMSPDTYQVGSQLAHDFELSGVHLSAENRAEAVKLNEEILDIGNNFVTGCSMPVAMETSGVEKKLQHLLTPCDDMPGYSHLTHTYALSADPEERWWAHSAFFYNEPVQDRLLCELLYRRGKLALLTGFPNYIYKATEHSTIGGPEDISLFLGAVHKCSTPHVSTELRRLQQEKQRTERTDLPLDPWDLQFYTERLRPSVDGRYREYLSLGTCMQGVDRLFTRIFGVSLRLSPTLPGEVWAPDVEKLEVVEEESGQVLGVIYCDFIDRPSKPAQNTHYTISGGKLLEDGSYQQPVVALLCSFTPDAESGQVLLSMEQLNNLVHELGHAMHSMLARTRYQHVTGTRCVTDFAEVPSNMMELFLSDSRVLSSIARHYKTDEPMPPDLMLDLQRSHNFAWATDLHNQLLYSLFDQRIYSEEPVNISLAMHYARIHFEYNPMVSKPKGPAPFLRFGHLYGYGAKYYSYLYCRALATNIWTHLFYQDPFSREAGMTYRRELLAHGGGRHPRHMMTSLLGEMPGVTSLSETLVTQTIATM